MKMPTYVQWRTGIMFTVGIGGIVYETIFHQSDVSPALLVLFLMLCGFPLVINLDQILQAVVPLAVTQAPVPPPSPPDPRVTP